MDPLVSVVIPAYDYGEFLSRAVNSVIDQTYKNFEIIIVDDCSNDNTAQIAKTFPAHIYNMRYIKHAKNKGPSAARNTGISQAKGEYIAFLDADDRWYPDKLKLQITEFSRNPGLGLVCTGYLLVDVNKNIEREYLPTTFENHQELIRQLLIRNVIYASASSALVKKKCFEAVGNFDESLRACEDWDMWLRIARYFEIGFIEKPLAVIYEHQKNTSRLIEKTMEHSFKVLEKNIPLFSSQLRTLGLMRRKAISHIYLDSARGYNNLNINRKKMIYLLVRSILAFPLKCDKKDNKYLLLLKQILPVRIQPFIKRIFLVLWKS